MWMIFALKKALTSQSSTCAKKHQIWMWHRRLGHASFGYIKHLFPSLFLDCNPSDFHCDVCTLAKSHCANYPLSFNKTTEPFTLIYPDVWGRAPVSTLAGYRWFVIFVEDCSRMTWLYLMTNKNDVYECFRSFHKMVQTQFSAKVKVLKSDNGGEFVSQVLQSYFQDHGIVHETTCPYTPQQNGVAKRKNWHIFEITRACLIDAHMRCFFVCCLPYESCT